jgi:hypothetical protein
LAQIRCIEESYGTKKNVSGVNSWRVFEDYGPMAIAVVIWVELNTLTLM